MPDVPGKWKIIVADGIGHRLTMKLMINLKLANLKIRSNMNLPLSNTGLAIIGIFVIFGFWGWIKEIIAFLK